MEGTSSHQAPDLIKPSTKTTESEDAVMSDSEVTNFRGALHDDESPALGADGQVVRKSLKRHLSTYFSNHSLPAISPSIYSTTRKGSYGMNAKSPRSEAASPVHGAMPTAGVASPTSPNSMRPSAASWTIKTFKPGGSIGRLGSLPDGGRDSLDKRAVDVNAFLHSDTQENLLPVMTMSLRGGQGSSPEPELPNIETSSANADKNAETEDVKTENHELQPPIASTSNASTDKKRNLDTPLPPPPGTSTSPGSISELSDPLPQNAILPLFSVTDLRSRVAASDAALDDEWAVAKKRQKELITMLSIWSEVAQQREKERVEKRLETRIQKCAMEEETLRGKKRHRMLFLQESLRVQILTIWFVGDQVVDAFKNVLGMLDNDGEDADEEDEEMGDWEDGGLSEVDSGQKRAKAQKLEGDGMEL